MKSMTIRLPDDLMEYLTWQAKLNKRTRTKHIEFLLERERKEDEKARYQLGLNKLCSNGTHYFASSKPAMNEFCNCQMYVFGEVVR